MNDTLRHWLLYFGCYVFGICTGALIEINHYEHPTAKLAMLLHHEAEKARHLQRVQELRFSLEKLERMKAVQDAFLKQASTNRDSIREMVAKLGERQR